MPKAVGILFCFFIFTKKIKFELMVDLVFHLPHACPGLSHMGVSIEGLN